MSRTILFLYGTLKSDQANASKLAGQEFLGPATTLPIYRLYSLGWHPAMVLDRETGLAVKGELWSVDEATRRMLDEYEGVPHWYDREPVAIADKVGDFQAYFYKHAVPSDAPSGAEWPLPE
jgi:gamma-glutamylaminecyclotransferase